MTWLADAHGSLLEIHPSCAGFTVRHWPPHARGPGTPLRDGAGSAALVVPTFVTAEQFRAMVGDRPGRYVLTPINATRKPLRAPAAVVVLGAGVELDDAIGATALASILTAITAAEQRTTAAITQLAIKLDDHRAWVEQQLATCGANASTPPPSPPTPTIAAPVADIAQVFAAVVAERDAKRAALLEIIEALPPLPRALLGVMAREGNDEQLEPFFRLAQSWSRADVTAALSSPELIGTLLPSFAQDLEISIEQIRGAWTEPNEDALPPLIRERLAALRS